MKKTFKVAQIRELLHQVHSDKITFSRYVEILNEIGDTGMKQDYYSKEEVEKGFQLVNQYYKEHPEDINEFGHSSASPEDIQKYSKGQANFMLFLLDSEKYKPWRFPFNH